MVSAIAVYLIEELVGHGVLGRVHDDIFSNLLSFDAQILVHKPL
jgi:hypothetical protein